MRLCMWSVVLSCFPYLVSFAASPLRYEALWNVTAFQHSHGSAQIFGRLTLCFVICVLGSSVQILLPVTPSATDFVAKVWALSPGRHLFYNVRFYESFSCLVLRTQVWVKSFPRIILHLCNFPPLTQISVLLLLFFSKKWYWSMHGFGWSFKFKFAHFALPAQFFINWSTEKLKFYPTLKKKSLYFITQTNSKM